MVEMMDILHNAVLYNLENRNKIKYVYFSYFGVKNMKNTTKMKIFGNF